MTRQDAIWHANHVFNIVIERCINAQNLKDAREFDEAKQIVIEALEQEPKRGEWQRFNYSDGDVMECTNCGYRDWRDRWLEDEVHNYCPNCGARMESDGK